MSQNCDLTCLPHVRSSTPLATTSVGPPGTHAVGTRRFLQSRNRDSNRLSAQQSELTSGPFERFGARIARDKPLAKTPGQKLQRRQTTVPSASPARERGERDSNHLSAQQIGLAWDFRMKLGPLQHRGMGGGRVARSRGTDGRVACCRRHCEAPKRRVRARRCSLAPPTGSES